MAGPAVSDGLKSFVPPWQPRDKLVCLGAVTDCGGTRLQHSVALWKSGPMLPP